MAHLRELKDKRLKIMEKLVENQTICRLLTYDTPDALTNTSLPDIEDKSSLFFTKIFPLPFVNIVDTFQGTVLNVFFGNISKNGVTFKDAQLKFVIACHYEAWLMESDLRPELIVCEIEDLINYKSGFGLGKMIFQYVRPVPIADKVSGLELCYQISDFN